MLDPHHWRWLSRGGNGKFFWGLGTHVTLVDRGDMLITNEDEDVARAFTQIAQRRFDVLLNARAQHVRPTDDGVS